MPAAFIWVNAADPDKASSVTTAATGAPLSASERQELLELRRKLKQVQMERDILAKAAAWFAGQSRRVRNETTFTSATNS